MESMLRRDGGGNTSKTAEKAQISASVDGGGFHRK
jgi:hypothetical protein